VNNIIQEEDILREDIYKERDSVKGNFRERKYVGKP